MKGKRKRKKSRINRRLSGSVCLSKALPGTIMRWSCVDPLAGHGEVISKPIAHKNWVYQLRIEEIKHQIKSATEEKRLKWRITVELEFFARGEKYYRAGEMVIFAVLADADGHYQKLQEELFAVSNMDHYVITNMTAEILPTGNIKDSDFKLNKGAAA